MNAEAARATAEQAVRVWDLPTRAFHWLLASLVVFSVISAHVGGNAMVWHMRSGFAIFTLLAFRLVWGFAGGHWSRFRAFLYAPSTSLRYLRGESLPHEHHHVGHNPLGAGSVFALLGILALQVATGLVADDEIASTGPLIKYVSAATSELATRWHKNYGQWIIVALVVLHIGAISFYWLKRRQNLVGPMLHGDKLLTADVPHSVDNTRSRVVALVVALVCALGVAAVVRLGG
ncbi:MAG: cytochrome b/b6 domain-containing protein [Burkholderiales bacterium]|nr:cytochrome b/b6 domain-containing protein [Burkholderiales bacterium]